MTIGITANGYTKQTLEEILAEWEALLRANIDTNLDLEPEQPFGQIIAIAAQREAVLQELIETLANAINPSAAEGFLADNVSEITGTIREPARKSEVMLNCAVGANFTASLGAMMANVNGQQNVRFTNKAAVDLTGSPAGTYPILFECTEYGPTVAIAGSVTVRTNTVSGWNSCTNPLDAEIGADREQDASLLARREDELAAPGACTLDSLRADVLQVDGVQQCYVFENVTNVTDGNGLPPHSFEVVIHDGATPVAVDLEVATTVWEGKPSGVSSHGATTVNVTDSTGALRAVKFSRATVLPVFLELPDVVVNPDEFPANGVDLIKTAIATAAAKYQNLAVDVVAARIKAAAFSVAGVLDVPTLYLGFTVSPAGTANLTVSGREIADVDTARIGVITAPGTP